MELKIIKFRTLNVLERMFPIPQIRTNTNTISNKISSPNFDCKKKYNANVKDTLYRFLNNQISPVLSRHFDDYKRKILPGRLFW